jgi:hypothetical protein
MLHPAITGKSQETFVAGRSNVTTNPAVVPRADGLAARRKRERFG